jgi:hypothetical protein
MIAFVILWNELEVKGTTDSQKSASSRDLDLEIDNRGRIKTKLYDKHDDIIFAIVNFSFNSSSISTSPSYGVYISQLMRYSWPCSQWFSGQISAADAKPTHCRHHNQVDDYEISISQMTIDHLLFT